MSKDILHQLQQRSSSARLTDPGPSPAQVDDMLKAACRAPDHARLRPWRFLSVSGERREALGAFMAEALMKDDPNTDQAALDKARNAPLRAPLIMIVISRCIEHDKVPYCEQQWSAACAAYAMLLAADAQGFGGIWRTGSLAFNRHLMNALGLSQNEDIIGFIYLGTRHSGARTAPSLDTGDYLQSW